jgi:hypothetical protein
VVRLRGRLGTVCARVARPAWSRGPSTSPLGGGVSVSRLVHVVGGLMLSALIPALAVGALGSSLKLISSAFVIALGHAVVLGVPAVALLWQRRLVNWVTALATGFVIGVLPVGFISWPLSHGNTNAWIDHVQTIANGVPTAAGWIQYLRGVVTFGAFGALGGVACWLWLRIWRALPTADGKVSSAWEPRNSLIASSIVVASVAAVLAIPAITKDRSCHNVLRDGRRSIAPQVTMDLEISITDWPRLRDVFSALAATNHLSFRDDSEVRPEIVRTLYLSVCNSGVSISTAEQRWAAQRYEAPIKGRGIAIGVYETHSGSGWEQLVRQLVGRLEELWPGKIRFRGTRGELIPMPKALSSEAVADAPAT